MRLNNEPPQLASREDERMQDRAVLYSSVYDTSHAVSMAKVRTLTVLRSGGTVEIREVIPRQESLSSSTSVQISCAAQPGIGDRHCVVEDHENHLGG